MKLLIPGHSLYVLLLLIGIALVFVFNHRFKGYFPAAPVRIIVSVTLGVVIMILLYLLFFFSMIYQARGLAT